MISTNIIPYGYFNEVNSIIEKAVKSILLSFHIDFVKNGFKDFYIGQKIQIAFNDSFEEIDLKFIIIDILIEGGENFGLLLIPESYEDLFPGNINPFLEEFGIKNLSVPKGSCFLAKHLGNDKFFLEAEDREIGNSKQVVANVKIPILYSIPKQTYDRLFILKNLLNNKLPFSIKMLLK